MDMGEWVFTHTEGASCFPVQVNNETLRLKGLYPDRLWKAIRHRRSKP